MTTSTKFDQQVFVQLATLSSDLTAHVALQSLCDEKVNAMYKIIVTGNGKPALPEDVRKHEQWIQEHDRNTADACQKNDSRNLLSIQGDQKKQSDAVAFKRQLLIVTATQIIGFIILSIEILLKMK